jgi:hypothetical protein
MKILNPYRFYRGKSGSGSQPAVPALVPPDSQITLKSISIAETVDLLCEGPIYGLVDQFGKKVYGLDMLKGIYLNKVPVMNYDGKYNFRSVAMEINLGTENQKPLQNFRNVYIWKPASFKLLGPITTDDDVRLRYSDGAEKQTGRPQGSVIGQENFTNWATGWPKTAKDPFIYVHHIKNKDVKKLRISLLIESLYDTVDQGSGKGQAGKMGMSKPSTLSIIVSCGVEGSKTVFSKEFTVTGTVTSPYACMLGESVGQFETKSPAERFSSSTGALINTSAAVGIIGTRKVGITEDTYSGYFVTQWGAS